MSLTSTTLCTKYQDTAVYRKCSCRFINIYLMYILLTMIPHGSKHNGVWRSWDRVSRYISIFFLLVQQSPVGHGLLIHEVPRSHTMTHHSRHDSLGQVRYISILKPNRFTIFEFIEYHSTCFGRSFRPSSGVQDCTYSIRYMSYWLADCLLAGSCPLASSQTNLYDIYLTLYVLSWTPDYGREDRPKHEEWYSINSKNCASIWFYYGNTLGSIILI